MARLSAFRASGVFAAMALILASSSRGAPLPITIPNFSFESPALPDGASTPFVDSWFAYGDCGTLNPSLASFSTSTGTDGANVAYVGSASRIEQYPTSMYPNTVYTLRVDVGHRLDRQFASATAQVYAQNDLVASDTITQLAPGGWATITLTWSAPIATPAQTPSLMIVLRSGAGGEAAFDRVRLTAEHAPSTLHVPTPEYPTINQATQVVWRLGGDTILVAPGVYTLPINVANSVFTLRGEHGAAETILDGMGTNRIFLADNAGRADPIVIDGVTFRNGNSSPAGAVYFAGAADIRNCRFENNHGTYGGGAIYLYGGANPSLSLTDCDFVGNQAEAAGAVLAHADAITVARCEFRDNTSSGVNPGGAEFIAKQSLRVERCSFVANRSVGAQAALRAYSQKHAITNCLFHANEAGATEGAGAAYFYVQDFGVVIPSLIANCTFDGNTAPPGALAGLGVTAANSVVVANTILWNNRSGGAATQDAQVRWVYSPVFTHMDVSGLGTLPGAGHISANPLFVSALGPDQMPGSGDEDFRLLRPSPCIDAADTPAIAGMGVGADLAGEPRARTDPLANHTGLPELGATWADIGAYEFQPPVCAGDLNSDGRVDFLDLNILLSFYAAPCGQR